MFCPPGLVFGGTEGVPSLIDVLRARTHFRQYRGRRVTFSCFAPPDSFSTVLRASGPISMFSAPGLVFGGTEDVGSRFHVLRSLTRFRRCRVRRVAFSRFARPDSFSVVPRALGPVFGCCAPRLVFGCTEGVVSRFQVLRARNLFRRYRGRRDPFSHFACTDSFSAVPRASAHVFMFCAPGLVFSGTEGVTSLIHVLRARTHFRQYRGRRVPFSCFALPDSFSCFALPE
jgi:hypothetical protein